MRIDGVDAPVLADVNATADRERHFVCVDREQRQIRARDRGRLVREAAAKVHVVAPQLEPVFCTESERVGVLEVSRELDRWDRDASWETGDAFDRDALRRELDRIMDA